MTLKVGRHDQFILRCLRSGKYRVTKSGEIFNTSFRGTGRERALAQWPNPQGYVLCELGSAVQTNCVMVHRIVLLAFLGEPPGAPLDCNHKSGVKSDNRLINLEWVTRSQNVAHAYRNGLKQPAGVIGKAGAEHHNARLSVAEVETIRRMYSTGTLQRDIAAQFGLTQSHVSALILRKSWKSILPESAA